MIGTRLQQALSRVGVTEALVSKWLGRPCNCQERAEKLNLLERWAIFSLRRVSGEARGFLEKILSS